MERVVYTLTDFIITFSRVYTLQLKDAIQMVGSKRYWKQALQFLDAKFLLIPIMFILLRMWTCILSIMFIYVQVLPGQVPSEISQPLIYLSVSHAGHRPVEFVLGIP